MCVRVHVEAAKTGEQGHRPNIVFSPARLKIHPESGVKFALPNQKGGGGDWGGIASKV